MSDYTPTTEHVREDFAYPWEGFKQDKQGRLEAFDRWHAKEIRKAKADAWEEGFTAGYDDLKNADTGKPLPQNPYTEES